MVGIYASLLYYPGILVGIYLLLCYPGIPWWVYNTLYIGHPTTPWVYPPSSRPSVSTTANGGVKRSGVSRALGSREEVYHG